MRAITCVAAGALSLTIAAAPAAAAVTTIPAIQSTIKWTKLSPTSATSFGNYARATSSVKYDPVTHVYTVRDTGSLTITSWFDLDNKDTTASTPTFTVVKNGANESFRVYNPGSTVQGIALTYVDYAQWRRLGPPVYGYGPGTGVNDTYLVWGQKTPSTGVPTSGTGVYTTAYDGTYINKTGAYAISGTGSLTANWLAHTIGFSANLSGAREGDSAALAGLGALTGGTGSFTASNFRTTGYASGGGYLLDLNGYFFGPTAQEVGGVFRLAGNGGGGEGAMVGKQ
jgi:hypothetical protein